MTIAKQTTHADKERTEAARWDSFSKKRTGPTDVMKEVTAEAVKKIEAIFEQAEKDETRQGD